MDSENPLSAMELERGSDYLGRIYGMESHEFVQAGKELMEYIVQFISTLRSQPAVARVEFGYLRPLLPEKSPNKPEDWDKIMDDFDRFIRPGLQSKIHPRFVGYFPTATSYPSILGDALTAVVATLPFAIDCSPAGSELENICSDWMAKALGLPEFYMFPSDKGGGIILPGASDSVTIAILAARSRAIRKYKKKFPQMKRWEILGKLVMYSSQEAHSCVPKGAELALLNNRVLPTDDRFRIRPSTLEKAIQADKENGLWPFLVVATMGTTSTASVDPIEEIGKICKREDLYFHVDGAYGGCFLICPEFRTFSKGMEYVDSFNTNPHKNLLVSHECGFLWVRDKRAHTSAFVVGAAFLETEESNQFYDYRNWGIALTRRMRSLKVWFVMKKYGISGIQEHIRRNVAVARVFEGLIRKDDRFEVFNDVLFSLICIRLKGSDALNEKLFEMVRETHAAYLSQTIVKNQYVIRVSVNSPHANAGDMKTVYNILAQKASELLEGIKSKEKIDTTSVEKQGQSSGNPDGTSQIDKSGTLDPKGSDILNREFAGKTSCTTSGGEYHSTENDIGYLLRPLD